jgi:pyridoxamine 5'-phosphate oxidase
MKNVKNHLKSTIDPSPVAQFDYWYKKHLTSGLAIPDSVSLGTSSDTGRVSVRTVLLKDYNDKGFVFYTNYNSKKGLQLSANPRAALLFYWAESGRQVRIEGSVEKVSNYDSKSYFKTRPKESQLAAWASDQSSVIPDHLHLTNRYESYKNTFLNTPVEKPPYWGGFRIIPDWFEFWQNGEFRLHDRITYTKRKDEWIIEQLAP